MRALIPVRDGDLPAGADEAIAECGGHAILAGSGTDAVDLAGRARSAVLVELGAFQPGRWAGALAGIVAADDGADIVVLPGTPDGRDLAPRLAHALERPLYAGATEIRSDLVRLSRGGGLELHDRIPAGPFVATLQPGVRGVEPVDGTPEVHTSELSAAGSAASRADGPDPEVLEVLPADVRTMDLAEARRIVGGGAGLDGAARFETLQRIATAIGAAMGATRVVTDRGWLHHDKQIGTTGVVVDPELYLAFGISGAVQHTAGLGTPDHIVSVNVDPHCPMMAMSDLGIVSDANETLDVLETLLHEIDDEETGARVEAADG